MAILSQEESQAILKKVLSFSTADECEATLSGSTGGSVRSARNAISTSGADDNVSLAVEARFGFVFARRGQVLGTGASFFLPRIAGISKSLEWCMSGRMVPAAEALEHGLVTQVVPQADLLAEANRLARDIADNAAPVSVALVRQMLWRGLGIDYEGGVLDHPARVAIHVVHRLGALVAALVLGVTAFRAIRTAKSRGVRMAGTAVAVMLVTQLILGPVMVLKTFPLPLATAHNAVAALLLLSTVALLRFLWPQQRNL